MQTDFLGKKHHCSLKQGSSLFQFINLNTNYKCIFYYIMTHVFYPSNTKTPCFLNALCLVLCVSLIWQLAPADWNTN